MQKLLATVTVALSVFLFSCDDKDPVVDPKPNPNPEPTDTTATNATMLTKAVLTSGSDVTTMTYRYDAQKRLVWYSNTSTKAGYFEDTSKIIRDASGTITQIVYRSDTSMKYNDPALDSIVFNVFSNAGKYTYKLSQYKKYNKNFKDSTVYTYDAQNRITTEQSYYFDYYSTSKVYKNAYKTDYTYDVAGNVTKLSTTFYKVDGVNDYSFNTVYTYDEKGVNLLNLGNEAILIGMQQNFSSKVPKTVVSTYPEAVYNRSYTYTPTYNKKYYPLKVDLTDAANGNAKSTLTFTYQ